ncbi:uncharacterized protein MONOS_13562 [Monocercomonoides exilis]|uniref:uncharacterized protein n=1 Tax=Monocercomonoides exilis TaxID=2049356 RepID=UPI003559606F|nr:hypothetical protein MONOS_13562 [Monocercomonoides exilis]|eukprot:MONOS_13562.1-p1 / transcript=MONOS_13562.1 / gene=MONOS_13562 / organism=Monocercomonoides_exilis_PA203 / gene_product=unspecified product / transcript_product=unspecified product / location=Mono_scaffold00845:22879-24019(+) / protein_length=362 / sequence_SO=supercontig / SO=protein_coding / is_pseudo=false
MCRRFERMLVDENKKNEEKNEKLLEDLCECYLLLNEGISSELSSKIVPCLLKVALKKEENEEIQKEVEIALLALNNIESVAFIEQKLYMKEITEIIKYHQEHHNLTQLAYQSAWGFLIDRLGIDKSLKEVIVNELHFVRDAISELEYLMKCVDWTRKKEEERRGRERRGKEAKEVQTIFKWLFILDSFFEYCTLWSEELVVLINSIVKVFQAARENNREISVFCVHSLRDAVKYGSVKVEDLLKGGAFDAVLEGLQLQSLDEGMSFRGLNYFLIVTRKMKKKTDVDDDEMEEEEEEEKNGVNKDETEKEAKRKELKGKVLEKIEEEGYEDVITSFHEMFDFLNRKYYDELSLDISDYFVNV